MIVADSKNHRLCVYNAEGQFLNQIQKPEIKRPSGLVLIPSSRNLFVLNLSGPIALVMYKL